MELGLSALQSVKIPLPQQPLQIDVADTEDKRKRANRLINERYAWRGYGSDISLECRADQISLMASDQQSGTTIGTLTVGVDSDRGLLAERVYPTEIHRLRTKGLRLCEITKLAVGSAKTCKPLLGRLFHMAFIHAHSVHRRTDLMIEVTPKHARFYQHLLHFEVAGAPKFNPRVNTYGVLLRLDMHHAAEQIRRLGGQGESSSEKSLYPYAMSPGEQRSIFGHLVSDETDLAVAA